MAAIGVPRHAYVWLGGWKRGSGIIDECYVDPTFAPSATAYELHNWALARKFTADAGTAAAATTLPDPREPSPTARDTPPHRVAARAILARMRALS